jgi:hypothetical protein
MEYLYVITSSGLHNTNQWFVNSFYHYIIPTDPKKKKRQKAFLTVNTNLQTSLKCFIPFSFYTTAKNKYSKLLGINFTA